MLLSMLLSTPEKGVVSSSSRERRKFTGNPQAVRARILRDPLLLLLLLPLLPLLFGEYEEDRLEMVGLRRLERIAR